MSYHDAFRHGIDQAFNDDPAEMNVYWGVLREMNSAAYRRGYVDIVVQRSLDKAYDIYDFEGGPGGPGDSDGRVTWNEPILVNGESEIDAEDFEGRFSWLPTSAGSRNKSQDKTLTSLLPEKFRNK